MRSMPVRFPSPIALGLSLALALALAPLAAENRSALLIANGDYANFGDLANPVPEARALKGVLEGLGFQVSLVENAGREGMIDALAEFEAALRSRGGTAFFHYGGHGVQVGGKNYLLPATADIPDEKRVASRSVDLDEVMLTLEAGGSGTNIVVLDACRDNPLPAQAGRSATRGLAVVGAKPRNSIIIYSAESGSVAQDGLFTPALTRALATPGLSLSEVIMQVRRQVYEQSKGTQIPGSYDQLFEQVYFVGKVPGGGSTVPQPPTGSAVAASGFVRVPAGSFIMGSPPTEKNRNSDEGPQHEVRLSAFSIGQYEVTQAEWQAVMGSNPSGFTGDNLPVESVSWYNILVYCNKRSMKEGLTPFYSISGDSWKW